MRPRISVIIPTRNRADLLHASLRSLSVQTLPTRDFEVIVVDDGSTDGTRAVCDSLAGTVPLRYFRIEQSGVSAAKNLGAFASTGGILLFFDDDDVADKELLRQHLSSHDRHPGEADAILGYTTWAHTLRVTELMHFVMNVGHYLFSYSHLHDGEVLDFSYFWSGRTSCKRALLVKHGVFRQELASAIEDVELGYRLSKFGLKVIFNPRAVQYMNRAVTFDDFCHRCESHGRGLAMFSRMHAHALVQKYCQLPEGSNAENGELSAHVARVRQLEAILDRQLPIHEARRWQKELHALYRSTFNSFKAKGFNQPALW